MGPGTHSEMLLGGFLNWNEIEIEPSPALPPQCIRICRDHLVSDHWAIRALQALPVLMAELAGREDQDFETRTPGLCHPSGHSSCCFWACYRRHAVCRSKGSCQDYPPRETREVPQKTTRPPVYANVAVALAEARARPGRARRATSARSRAARPTRALSRARRKHKDRKTLSKFEQVTGF